jgi:ATP-dependent DNA helicase RecG
MNISVEILTGSTKSKKRREIHQNLEDGTLHILIGTHALLEDKVKFLNLGMAIIDEQHRFGVAQRSKLWKKKYNSTSCLSHDRNTHSKNVGHVCVWRFRYFCHR